MPPSAAPLLRRTPLVGDAQRRIPDDVPVRSVVGVKGFGKQAASSRVKLGGVGGAIVPEQVVNITQSPAQDDVTPFWSNDEQFLFYSSNRELGRYQIYRVGANASSDPGSPAPATPIRLTNADDQDYLFPALNANGTRMVFIRSVDTLPVFQSGSSLLNPGKRWDLYVANTPTGGGFVDKDPGGGSNLISLTAGRSFRGKRFTNVKRPAWIGANDLVFSAQLEGSANYHLFTVNVTSALIFQLTDGAADEQNPAVSANGLFLAFDSNATPDPTNGMGYTGGGQPRQETDLGNPATAAGVNSSGRRNIFVVGVFGQNARQFTNRYIGAPDSNNVQPAWSSSRTNQFTNPDGQAVYIAFASNRRDVRDPQDPARISRFTEAGTFDIYYVHAEEVTPGQGTTLVEGIPSDEGENPARKLDTADPSYQFNDEYPAWPQFLNIFRMAHQSDRTGTLRRDSSGQPFVGNFTRTPGVRDLFISTIIDITAPTLLRYDTSRADGEVLHINQGRAFSPSTSASVRTPAQGLVPGVNVYFTVRVEDRESGLRSDNSPNGAAVYLEFKNPNSKYQQNVGREFKEWTGFTSVGNITIGTNFPQPLTIAPGNPIGFEYECMALGQDAQYYLHRFTNGASGPLYVAGTDDAFAFSGADSPPLDGGTYTLPDLSQVTTPPVWLKLTRLPQNQQDNQGGVLYGAAWTTPALASDWYVDVIAYDQAVNPFAPDNRSNWIIYDNVWGFSTYSFTGINDVLVVSDYALGQKFFASRFGESTEITNGNLLPIFYGSESYFTDVAAERDPVSAPNSGTTPPKQYNLWPFIVTVRGAQDAGGIRGGRGMVNALGVNSYTDEYNDDGTRIDGRAYPVNGRYEIWRILSRGPVTPDILGAYLPRPQQVTPPDLRTGETGNRTARSVERMVVWNTPFSGDLFVGPGTIIDQTTQTNLTNFVNAGGRLFVSGQDIGFALTFNGARNNAFFTNVLKAQYATDSGGDHLIVPTVVAGRDNSIADDPWERVNHAYGRLVPNTGWVYDPPTGTTPIAYTNTSPVIGDYRADASATARFGPGRIDVITPIDDAYTQFNFRNGQTGLITSSFASGGKVAYFSGGFESVGYDWYDLSGVLYTFARRAEIMHNITCSFRTGTITGSIRNSSQGGAPLADVLVRAVATVGNEGDAAVATAATDASGRFQLVGLKPDNYVIYAYQRGFTIQHTAGISVHGDDASSVDLSLTEAPPGVFAGKVLQSDGTTPIPGIEVQLRAQNPSDLSFFVLRAVSGADGSFQIPGVPIGFYTVIYNPSNVDENGNPIPASDPRYNRNYQPGFSTVVLRDPNQADVIIGPNTTVGPDGRVQIKSGETATISGLLSTPPQSVSGQVRDKASGAGIPNATVIAKQKDKNGEFQEVTRTTTDADGNFSFPAINGGDLNLEASAPGYQDNAVTVTVGGGPLTGVIIELTKLPPGSVSGLVTNGSTGAPIPGATVTLTPVINGVEKPDLALTTTTGPVQTTDGGYKYNYRFPAVVAGTYIARVAKTALSSDPVQIEVTVKPGVFNANGDPVPNEPGVAPESFNVNFRLLPVKTFGEGLQLISVPVNYANTDPRRVFGLTPNTPAYDAFTVAKWTGEEYVVSPTIPLLVGEGYFVRFGEIADVLLEGTPITGNTFDKALPAGWWLIGNPFYNVAQPSATPDVELLQNVQVLKAGSTTPLTYQQAVDQNLVSRVVYSFTGSNQGAQYLQATALRPWLGYWIRAYQPVTLRFNRPTITAQSARSRVIGTVTRADLERPVMRSIESRSRDDWRLQIAARQGGLLDTDNSVGVASGAKDGFDFQFDTPKPPMITQIPTLYVAVKGVDETGRAANFSDNVTDAASGTKRFDFTVTSGSDEEITLFFPNINRLPRGIEPVLIDVANGRRVPLRTAGSSYRFAPSGRSEKAFRIEITRAVSQPLAILNLTQTRSGRSGAYRIGFTTTRSAEVQAQVKTLTGRTLRTLATRSRATEQSALLWDGRAEDGSQLPVGPYVLSLTAKDDDGNIATQRVFLLNVR